MNQEVNPLAINPVYRGQRSRANRGRREKGVGIDGRLGGAGSGRGRRPAATRLTWSSDDS